MKYLNWLALVTSVGIAGIAAYFSVLGLATIFAGAFMGIVIMAGALEFGKIVTAAYSTSLLGQTQLSKMVNGINGLCPYVDHITGDIRIPIKSTFRTNR